MLTIHHLGRSQSERIVWLCEELGIPYALHIHTRDPVTMLSPPSLKAVSPTGSAPVIEDAGLVLAESGAILDYIIAVHGGGRLVLTKDHPDFAQYLYWLHFANGTLQPAMGRMMVLNRLKPGGEDPILLAMRGRLETALRLVEARVGFTEWLAGAEFTAADIMLVFSLTTMRLFQPLDLAPWPAIRAYLGRVGARPGYQRAMAKGDPGFAPMLA